jgi:3D (Asp-Asp-Asp) domain-containing protein
MRASRILPVWALAASTALACGPSVPKGAPGAGGDAAAPATNDSETGATSPDDASNETLAVDSATSAVDSATSMDSPAPEQEASVAYTMLVTFYGWEDNSPPGDAIAYGKSDGFPTVHDVAGGAGTYADPLTLATDVSELAIGTRVYLPFCQKYAVVEDDCVECDADWSSSMSRHIDIWMNSDGTESASALMACEDQWTQNATSVVVAPAPGLPVGTTPLFTPATNTCALAP